MVRRRRLTRRLPSAQGRKAGFNGFTLSARLLNQGQITSFRAQSPLTPVTCPRRPRLVGCCTLDGHQSERLRPQRLHLCRRQSAPPADHHQQQQQHQQQTAAASAADSSRTPTSACSARRSMRTDTLQRMAQREAQLKHQLHQLERAHSTLSLQHELAVACCDGLVWLRQLAAASSSSGGQPGGEHSAAREAEEELLQQLAAQPAVLPPDAASACRGEAACDAPAAAAAAAAVPAAAPAAPEAAAAAPALDGTSPIAPRRDVLWVLRALCAAPPLPDEARLASLSASQLCDDYARTQQVVVNSLVLLDNPFVQQHCRVAPLNTLQAAILRHMRILLLLALRGRVEAIHQFTMTNTMTAQQLPDSAWQHRMLLVQHEWALARLRLSAQQRGRIADGAELLGRLLAPVLHERAALQHAQPACVAAGSATGGRLLQRASDEQQVWLRRVQVLMGKEHCLRVFVSAFTLGQLSWVQAAQLVTDMALFVPQLGLVAKIVMQQQQQQQCGQQGREEGAVATLPH